MASAPGTSGGILPPDNQTTPQEYPDVVFTRNRYLYYRPPPITEPRLLWDQNKYIKSLERKWNLERRPSAWIWDDFVQRRWASRYKAQPTDDPREIMKRNVCRPLYPLSVQVRIVSSSLHAARRQ